MNDWSYVVDIFICKWHFLIYINNVIYKLLRLSERPFIIIVWIQMILGYEK
jgi:hypothetical protein